MTRVESFPSKISMSELQRLMRDPDVPEAQLKPYFTAHAEASRPFAPAIIPNPDRVDVAAPVDELEGAMMMGWANGFSRLRRQTKFKQRRDSGDKSPVLVSEGNSWFQFPILLDDVIDQLYDDYNIWSVDAAGDTLQNMVLGQPEYMEALSQNADSVQAFLFSGAGNDFLGDDASGRSVLPQILRAFKPGMPAEWYLQTDAFADKLRFVEDCYRKVLSNVQARYPSLPVICHGYDYAIPGGGPGDNRHPIYAAQDNWLGRPMREELGIVDPTLQRSIVKLLIDKLNICLASLCGGNGTGGAFKNAWHVDARNTVRELALWADELHPTDEGFSRVAAQFRSVLRAAIPSVAARTEAVEEAAVAPTPYARKLVSIANAEYDRYHGFSETDEPLRSRINQYCREIGIEEPDNISDFAWSATFVSWCVKTAGATAGEFKFDPTHAVFVRAAIANADNNAGVFRARPIDQYRPKIGDIIHRNQNHGRVTYKQARSRSNYPSHSAIVVEIGSTNGVKFAGTIGGNESNSVHSAKVVLNQAGFVAQKNNDPFICIIENLKVGAAPVMPEISEEATFAAEATTPSFVCEASGEPEAWQLEEALIKPKVNRVESTGNKSSRGGTDIDHIVIHYTTSRNIEGSIGWFKTKSAKVSAHYIVGRDGVLVQMVPDKERAWHAGTSEMNARSIGIEHVAMDGDKITDPQARTSLALIRWLMQEYQIPIENVIPHVCVKSTSCCGDLFKDFGGGAGLSCKVQNSALHKWLDANGIGGEEASVALADTAEAPYLETAFESPETLAARRLRMAKIIVDFEARRDRQGHLAVYRLRREDGGGRYEVAGINERYHKQECDQLVRLIESGRYAEAEDLACEFIAKYTDPAAAWCQNGASEFYLRDCMFNRGPRGAAKILQRAVGVTIDGDVGPQTLAAVRGAEMRPLALLDELRKAREWYERVYAHRNEGSVFWQGLVNRWNNSKTAARQFLSLEEAAFS